MIPKITNPLGASGGGGGGTTNHAELENLSYASSGHTGFEASANKTASWSATPNDTKYPSEKLVYDALGLKQVINPGVSCVTPISYNDIVINYTERTLTIVPALGYFDIIIDGEGTATPYRKTGNQVFSWTDTTGSWYFYYNNLGVAVCSQTGWDNFETQVPIYKIDWDATKSPDSAKSVSEGWEAHCGSVSGATHKWMHAYKSIWVYGLNGIGNPISSGTPNVSGLNTCISLTTGQVMDDNLSYTVTNGTGSAKFEQNMGVITPASLTISNGGLFTIATTAGAGGTNLPATRFPFDWNSSTNIPNYITANGTRTPVSSTNYFVYFLFAYQDPRNGQAIRLISAHVQFANITDARAYTWDSLISVFPGLGTSNEVRPLYRYIFEYRSSYNVAIKHTALREVADIRRQMVSISTATGAVAGTSVIITPYGNISSTNAQSAIQELDDDKLTIGGDTKGSKVTIGTNDAQDFAIETNNTERATIKSDGKILIGDSASLTDFPNAQVNVSHGNTGHTFSGVIGLTAEAMSNGVDPATGLGGCANTNGGSTAARGITGVAKVANTTDTGNAIAIMAYANDAHSGGNNFGVNASAQNSTQSNFAVYAQAAGGGNNWSFYGQAGNLYNNGAIAIKTANPTKDLSIDGTVARTFGVDRNTNTGTAGADGTLTVSSGSTVNSTDKNSGKAMIRHGENTGLGGGVLALQSTTIANSTGTGTNTFIDRYLVVSQKNIVNSTDYSLFEGALPANTSFGGSLSYAVECSNGTDYQRVLGVIDISAYNKAGVYDYDMLVDERSRKLSSGTLTIGVWSLVSGTNNMILKCNYVSSLTPTSFKLSYQITNNSAQAITILA